MMGGYCGCPERECFSLMRSWPFSSGELYGRVNPFLTFPGGLKMRRLSGLLLAGAIMLLPVFWQVHGTVFAQDAPQKTTFTGDMVLWAFAVNADKTADYEQVVAKLKDALSKSERPEAKRQLAGWKMMKNVTPQPDGSVVYIHVTQSCRPGRRLLDHEHRLRGVQGSRPSRRHSTTPIGEL